MIGRPLLRPVTDGRLVCGTCGVEKETDAFCRSSSRSTGRQYSCKACQALSAARRYHTVLRHDDSYKDTKRAYDARRRVEKGAALRAYDRARHKTAHRKAQTKGRGRQRKAGIGFATPAWLTKTQRAQIRQMYRLAQKLETITGQKMHVDHIVPLRGENVCGLHVPWNLRILDAELNQRRSNRADRIPLLRGDL